jgi:hypothetical protein
MSIVVILNVIFATLVVLAIPGMMAWAIWSSLARRAIASVQ